MARKKKNTSKIPFLGLPFTPDEEKVVKAKLKLEGDSARKVLKKLLVTWAST